MKTNLYTESGNDDNARREMAQSPYYLYRPPHLIANEVIRRIENVNDGKLILGELSHLIVTTLVTQYQNELMSQEQKFLEEISNLKPN